MNCILHTINALVKEAGVPYQVVNLMVPITRDKYNLSRALNDFQVWYIFSLFRKVWRLSSILEALLQQSIDIAWQLVLFSLVDLTFTWWE